MQNSSLQFLKDLIAARGPSGFEQPVAQVWRNYAANFAQKIDRDLHGNSIAELNAEGAPRIMLSGHCDEIGFLVKYIDEKGFIYFSPIGGHDRSLIGGRRVNIHTENGVVKGVTGKKALHLMSSDEREKGPEPFEKMWIDIGASSREEAMEQISIGDPVTHDLGFQKLTDDVAASRAFDNRAGAFVVAEALRYLQGEKFTASVFSVATVQEEIGLRGATTSAFSINPVVGIGVDVTHATDHPEVDVKKDGEIKLGKGPVIFRGANANPKVFALLKKAADEENIPFQIRSFPRGTGTDANPIQLARGGVAAGLVSVPLRYMHTPSEVASLRDIDNAAKLLAAFIKRVTSETDFRP